MSKYDNASLVQIPSGYKAGTLYSVLPANGDGDFDFTRASIATRVNSQGLIETVASGVPRLDYPLLNGVVQSCPSLLLEPARTNIVLRSEDLDTGWSKLNVTIVNNSIVSPDGNISAGLVTATSTSGQHADYDTFAASTTPSVAHYISCFVKKSTTRYVRLNEGYTGATLNFDLDNGVIVSLSGGASNSIVQDFGSGWYRIGFQFTSNATGDLQFALYLNNNSNTNSYAGAGEAAYLWGAQIELGSYITSYIPTSGSTITRAAEVCNGAGTASDFNDSEGVLFAEISALADGLAINRALGFTDGTLDNRVIIFYSSATNLLNGRVSSATVTSADMTTPITPSTNNKLALKYKLNDFSLWLNGFEVATDTSGATPIGLSEMAFDNGAGATNFEGKTKQLIAFDAALTDEQLEDLTSWDSFEELAASQSYILY